MLQAELHGHASREILGNEDYLTSAVFGHLRYLPPLPFWQSFFLSAVGADTEGPNSLLQYLTESGAQLSECNSLEVRFWPSHNSFGTPDLCLCFSGPGTLPSLVLIEAKLWAGKSGKGNNDQLLRYLMLLRQLETLELPLSAADRKRAVKALLFLTPHDSAAEIGETAELCAPHPGLKHLLFRAQWQDIAAAASECAPHVTGQARMILHDISGFLRHRNLEYFAGFARVALPPVAASGAFYGRTGIFGQSFIPPLGADAGSFYKRGRQTGHGRQGGMIPMDSDYGVKLGQALGAVARLHADTSKLLVDCDKHIGKGRRSLFRSYVTRDLTYNVKADFWMPEGVFRHYDAGGLLVDSVTVTFFMPPSSGDPDSVPQPLFQVGRIQYRADGPGKAADVKSVCQAWDLWWLFFKLERKIELGRVLECADVEDGRIAWARYIAVPLVSISSIEDAIGLYGRVTQQAS